MKKYIYFLALLSCLLEANNDESVRMEIKKWLKNKTNIFYTHPNTTKIIPDDDGGGVIKFGVPFINKLDNNSSIWEIELGKSQRSGKKYFGCDGEYLLLFLNVKTWKVENVDRNFTCEHPEKMKLDFLQKFAEKTENETQLEKKTMKLCLLQVLNNDNNRSTIENCGIVPAPEIFTGYYFLKNKDLKSWMMQKTSSFNQASSYRVNFSADGTLLWELRYSDLINKITVDEKDIHSNVKIYLYQDTMKPYKVDIDIINNNIFSNKKSLEGYNRKITSCISNSIRNSKINDPLSKCGLITKKGEKGTIINFE